MPPSLPSRPTKDPDKLSASWLCKLLDCVAYGMSNPRGDGKTILNESSGTLRALRQPGGGTDGGASAYAGPFAVVKKDDTTVTVLAKDRTNGKYEQNLIECGDYRDEITEPVDITIGTLGLYYIYLHFFWDEDGQSYFWEYLALESEIVNSDGHYYELLAYVIRPTGQEGVLPPFEVINAHWGIVKIVGKLVAYGYSAEA